MPIRANSFHFENLSTFADIIFNGNVKIIPQALVSIRFFFFFLISENQHHTTCNMQKSSALPLAVFSYQLKISESRGELKMLLIELLNAPDAHNAISIKGTIRRFT